MSDAWPYSLLNILLYKVEEESEHKLKIETTLTDRDLIKTSLKFTYTLEQNGIQLVSDSQRLMYLMLAYFGNDREFLDNDVKQLIGQKLKGLRGAKIPASLDVKLNGQKSFESLYKMFLDTFQNVGYSDDLFGVLVMLPLAQKYDVRWRKLVWSEFVPSLRFITCKESDLIDSMNDYLQPVETDISLLKSYESALNNSAILQAGSIPWKIAKHHVQAARESRN